MPVHDWTKGDAGIFHDFHCAWIIHLKEALNEGLLPDGFYAMAEQHAHDRIPDVLTLRAPEKDRSLRLPEGDRGVALADAPPRVSHKMVADSAFAYHTRRRTLTIRHVSDHRIVALLEIVSPGNKDRASCVEDFAQKVDSPSNGAFMSSSRICFLRENTIPRAFMAQFGRASARGLRHSLSPAIDTGLLSSRRPVRRSLRRASDDRRSTHRNADVPRRRFLHQHPARSHIQ